MDVDYNRIQTRVGVGLVKTKNTWLGLKKEGRGVTYITQEKRGDIWILRKCMFMYVHVFWRTELNYLENKNGREWVQLGWTVCNRGKGRGYGMVDLWL